MPKIRIIGDVHGLKSEFELILKNTTEHVTQVFQVGDMGVGFGQGEDWHESLDKLLIEHNCRWIRGNHDSPEECKEMKSWIKDGTVCEDWMFVGGAWSIDYSWRIPNVSWWEDEELSYEELDLISSIYEQVKPRVMITHDFPKLASDELFFSPGKPLHRKPQYKTKTASALQSMFESHQPDLWVAGHWHFDADKKIENTRFVCVNELSFIDVDKDTLEIDSNSSWRPIP